MSLDVTFWGARGSFPAIGPRFARYGGDTSCVAVEYAGRTCVFDAGTGLARLGKTISGAADIDLFLSHAHLDHVIGLMYFDPIWRAETKIRIWLEESVAAMIRAALCRQFGPPFHPVALEDVPAALEWKTYRAGARFAPHAGLEMTAKALPHPGGAFGLRLEAGGASFVYGADCGALASAERAAAVSWAERADLLALDATFTCAESEAHPDWGHMSWREAAEFGAETGAVHIVLFHHGPDRTDAELDEIAADARKICPRAVLARDGLRVALPAAAHVKL